MLDDADIERLGVLIRRIIREEFDRFRRLEANAERQRRWYEEHHKKPNALNGAPNALPSENLTPYFWQPNALPEEKPNALGKNGHIDKEDLLMVSPTPLSLISQENTSLRAREHSNGTNGTTLKRQRQLSPLMNKAALEEFKQIPIYEGIDIEKEAWKFKTYCEENNKTQTRRRFINWLNRIT